MAKKCHGNIISLIGILAILSAGCSALQRKMNPNLDRDISGPVTISSEWLEINAPEPLKPERENNEVMLVFKFPYHADYQSNGLRFPDGSVVVPEAQLIDQDGNVHQLREVGLNDHVLMFGKYAPNSYLDGLPKDKVYRTVRLKSSRPIECSKIVWRSYNQQDRK